MKWRELVLLVDTARHWVNWLWCCPRIYKKFPQINVLFILVFVWKLSSRIDSCYTYSISFTAFQSGKECPGAKRKVWQRAARGKTCHAFCGCSELSLSLLCSHVENEFSHKWWKLFLELNWPFLYENSVEKKQKTGEIH